MVSWLFFYEDRKSRIEVGNGMEPFHWRIAHDLSKVSFKEGKYAKAHQIVFNI
jgi:hypothetical protein